MQRRFRASAWFSSLGISYTVPSDHDRYNMMKTYYLMLQEHGEADAVGKMKQFATYFTHGVRNGSKLRVQIYHLHEVPAILDAVDAFFSDDLAEESAQVECVEVA